MEMLSHYSFIDIMAKNDLELQAYERMIGEQQAEQLRLQQKYDEEHREEERQRQREAKELRMHARAEEFYKREFLRGVERTHPVLHSLLDTPEKKAELYRDFREWIREGKTKKLFSPSGDPNPK